MRTELQLRVRLWDLRPGLFVFIGTLPDPAVHYHPAVHVAVGAHGPMRVMDGYGAEIWCRAVVIGSGTRHALRADPESEVLSACLGLETAQGLALNTLSMGRGRPAGIWVVDDGARLADAAGEVLALRGPCGTADFVIAQLLDKHAGGSDRRASVHPQLQQALELVAGDIGRPLDLASVAAAVGLSPDYLGRLYKRQTGVSFSATVRWARLLAGLRHFLDGAPLAGAASMAGFTDVSHGHRACRELAGAAPGHITRALLDSRPA